jgi:isoleucyl-tRNA synthetase
MYSHPLCDRVSSVLVGGDYVTADSGTGLVHSAPGHGQEDYQVRRSIHAALALSALSMLSEPCGSFSTRMRSATSSCAF